MRLARSVAMLAATSNGVGEGEDRQIEGDQDEGDEDPHADHDGWFDEREGRGHAGLNIVFVELGDTAEHGGQAPVDSPTSIMSMESSGKILVSARDPESEFPSLTDWRTL